MTEKENLKLLLMDFGIHCNELQNIDSIGLTSDDIEQMNIVEQSKSGAEMEIKTDLIGFECSEDYRKACEK